MSNDDLSDFVTTTTSKKGPWRNGSGPIIPIIHGIAWCFSMAVLVFVVPRFESIFKDFGVDLPQLTKVLIKASHFAVKFALVLVPLLVVLMVLDGRVQAALVRKGEVGAALAWSILMMAAPLVVLALVVVGVVLPFMNLMTRLSG